MLTGLVLGFARCLGEFGATITFAANIPGQTQTLPLALFSLTEAPGNEMAAARLAVIGVALAMVALLTSEVMARRVGAPPRPANAVQPMIEVDIKKTLGPSPWTRVLAPRPAR